jgi:hypothetical protein
LKGNLKANASHGGPKLREEGNIKTGINNVAFTDLNHRAMVMKCRFDNMRQIYGLRIIIRTLLHGAHKLYTRLSCKILCDNYPLALDATDFLQLITFHMTRYPLIYKFYCQRLHTFLSENYCSILLREIRTQVRLL